MTAAFDISNAWIGRLVRMLVLFRALVLLVTVIVLPARQHTPFVAFAFVLAALTCYLPLRHWSRISATVARHPAYLATEVFISTLVLAAASVRSPFFYFTLGTAAMAGVVYGRRGAIPFSALLIAVYEVVALEGLPTFHANHSLEYVLFEPMLYPVVVAAGIAARDMVERGVATERTVRERTEALSAERERLRVARELHDSLAKTVEGLAMTASVLPRRCERDPAAAAEMARALAQDARHAALEARMLMSDLRPDTTPEVPLQAALRQRAQTFAERSGVEVEVDAESEIAADPLPAQTTHELLRIVGEALNNAVRHGGAGRVRVSVDEDPEGVAVRVSDDGEGLAEPVDLERLKAEGHYGLAGMHERARGLGGDLSVEPRADHGTTVTVRLPTPGDDPLDEVVAEDNDGGTRWWPLRRRGATVVAPSPEETA